MRRVMVVLVAAVVLSGNAYAQRADVLELRGAGSQIGVTIRDAADGVTIGDVAAGTPAERAGFKAGDLVVSFDGEAVRSARQLQRLVEETPPGKAVSAVVTRAGARQTLTVTPERGRVTDFGRQLPDRFAYLRRRLPELRPTCGSGFVTGASTSTTSTCEGRSRLPAPRNGLASR